MRLEIRMPKLSEFSDDGVIAKWRVAVGDVVHKGEAVADVDLDMSRTEILAEADGKIVEIWVLDGQSVPVGTVIAMQSVDDAVVNEEPAVEEPQQDTVVEEAPEEKIEDESEAFPELGDEANPYVEPEIATEAVDNEEPVVLYGQILASPAAIQLAEQHNVNLGNLIGTGSCGLIERADVEAAMQTNSQFVTVEDVDDLMNFEGDFASKLPSDEPTESSDAQVEAPAATEVAAEAPDETVSTPDVIYMSAGPESADEPEALAINESNTIDSDEKSNIEFAVEEEPGTESEPVKLDETTVAQVIEQSVSESRGKSVKVRRLVARKMQQSWEHAPHFFVTVAVDMTDVIRFRADLGVTINDFILAATARTLQEHPWVNSYFIDDEAVEQSAINISLAVATEQGLYYPVVKDCAGKSVKELGIASAEMVVKAHSGKLTESEMADGSFTISNMGMLDVESFSAIITPPQVAVLAVGTVRGEVIIDEYEEMTMAPMVRLTLSGDHRALDGADAADFLGTMRSYLEAPITLVASQEDN